MTYDEDTSSSPGSDWLKVVAGGKSVRVEVTQSGKSQSRMPHSSSAFSNTNNLSVIPTSISMPSEGGTTLVDVATDGKDYALILLPSWVKLKNKNLTSFSLTCAENTSTSPRSDWFKVAVGGKTVRVTITQSGKDSSKSTYYSSASSYAKHLSVIPTSITMPSDGGTTFVDITTDSKDYAIMLLPSWVKLKNKNSKYFSLTCAENTSTSPRSDWFKVAAGGETVRVEVTQKGKSSYDSYSQDNSYGTNRLRPAIKQDKVFSIGLDISFDFFSGSYSSDRDMESYSDYELNSIGLGLRARIGRYDQWFNLIGGMRYLFGEYEASLMVPVLLNLNLLKIGHCTGYIGGGYEFGVYGDYYDDYVLQAGFLIGSHTDFQFFHKPNQEVFGAGFTLYF